ncbi:PQQ-binding-like beta-propeller repeat protein [Actinosynnema sp. CA-299493]
MVLAGAGCALVSLFVPRERARVEVIDYPYVLFVVAVGVAAHLVISGRRWVGVALAGVVFGLVAVAVGVDVAHGLPEADLPLLAVGALAVAVGGPAAGSWRVRPLGVLGAAVVVVAAVVAPGAVEAAAVRSEVRGAWTEPPRPVVELAGVKRWEWQPPARLVGVVAAGHGVAVGTEDGAVVGLDGADGRPQWRYARFGALLLSVSASPDGRSVLALFDRGRQPPRRLLVGLDADTGTPRFERAVEGRALGQNLFVGATSVVTADSGGVSADDPGTGEERWRWPRPDGCTASVAGAGPVGVTVAVSCEDRLAVVGLAEDDGRELWRHTTAFDPDREANRQVEVVTTTDGSVAHVRMSGDGLPPDALTDALVDVASGRVTRLVEPPAAVEVGLGPTPVLRDRRRDAPVHAVDPATGRAVSLDVTGCPLTRAAVTTTTRFVRLCSNPSGELSVSAQGLDGSAPITTALPPIGGLPFGIDGRLTPAPGALVIGVPGSRDRPGPVVGFVP